ncbi:MAG: MoaD/ThiS family protein [Flavobacteriales bacterium]|nr:MoaD/ThiS family protein [Flavobacteriales bacterium]
MKVLLFGLIAERAGTPTLELSAASTNELKVRLAEHIEGLAALTYAIAVDHRMVIGNMPLNGHEEVAVLPPFAGG